jgi:4'-phosphopantetheinyl transferase EntD
VALRAEAGVGVGIDLVEIEQAREGLRTADAFISSVDEEHDVGAATGGQIDARTLLFSGKESAIKALSAGVQRFVDFTEIHLVVEGYTFMASFGRSVPGVRGWWKVDRDLLVTGAISGKAMGGL